MAMICGLDEAGRGPLAGPIVAAAVLVEAGALLDAVDSKKLTSRRRHDLAQELKSSVYSEIEIIDVAEINANGIGWANREVFQRLIRRIDADYYIVDGNLKLTDLGDKTPYVECRVRADASEPVVSAASIIAKTTRDAIMLELHAQFPYYHWDRNKGYGTKEHISAIKTFGSTPHHRGMYVDTVKSKPYAEPILLLGSGEV